MKHKLKRTLSILLILSLLLTLVPMGAMAVPVIPLNTIFVPHTGSAAADEAALRDAFAQGPGYTIELETGTWHLTGAAGIELQEGQTLIGNGSTIHAALAGAANGVVFRSRVDNVTLSDFTLIRAGWGLGAALCIGGREPGGAFSPYASDRSSNIVLKDITVECSNPQGGARVMSLHGVNSISIENLIFNIGSVASGIHIASSVDVTIENFTINSSLDVQSIIFSYSSYYRLMPDGDTDYSIRDLSITGLNLGIALQPVTDLFYFYSPPWTTTNNRGTLSFVDRFLSLDFETIHIEDRPYVAVLHTTALNWLGNSIFLLADMNELLSITLPGLGSGIGGLIYGLPWFGIETGLAAPDNRNSGLIIEMDDQGDTILFNWNTEVPGVTVSDPWPWGSGPYTTTGGDLITNVTFEIIYTTDGSDPRGGGNIFDGIAASATNANTIRAVGRITIRDNVSNNYIVIFTELLGTTPPVTHTVTFNLNGGIYGGNQALLVQTIPHGQNATALTANPTRPGFTFNGWSPALNLENVTEDRTFIAQWVANNPGGPGLGNDPWREAFLIGRTVPAGQARPIDPRGNITRAEVATIFFRLISDEARGHYWAQTNPFDDVTLERWFNNAISTTTNMGLFEGIGDDLFAPERNITRGELAAVLVRFMEREQIGAFTASFASGSDEFDDIADHWARAYINEAARQGWVQGDTVNGVPTGTFRPGQPLTRAETAAMINRMFERLIETPDCRLYDMVTWPDNQNENAWYFLYMYMASNSYTYRWRADSDRYKALVEIIEPRDWSVLERPDSRPGDILASRGP